MQKCFLSVTQKSPRVQMIGKKLSLPKVVFIIGKPADSKDFSDLKLIAEGIVKLEDARKYFSKHINIKLDPSSVTSEDINKLYEIAQKHRGNCRLVFHYPMNGKTKRKLLMM